MAEGARPLDELYTSPDGEFEEFLPISDDTVERYAESLDQAESLPPGPGQHKGARDDVKPKRKRSRNAHQLHLNKLAQVRYRERKRQQQASLEAEVKALNDQVTELKQLEQQSAELEARNAALQQQLAERQAELQRLRQAAADPQQAGGKPALTAAEKKAELDRLVQKWLDTVEEIRQLYGLLLLDPAGSNAGAVLKQAADLSWLPPGQQRLVANVSARITALTGTVISLCLSVLRLDGPRVESLMAANYDRCKSLAGWRDPLKWVRAAQELNLSEQQVAAMLQARESMLGKLQSIYSERQQLNAEAVRGLLGAGGGAALSEAEQQRLFEVLRLLEANLKAEQRAIAEQEFVTFQRLLTPIQGGLFILKAFPDHCDVLALLNAVHQLSQLPQQ